VAGRTKRAVSVGLKSPKVREVRCLKLNATTDIELFVCLPLVDSSTKVTLP